MDAYIALVQETKNTRLKYLLAQTDEYIATIRNMIRDQRQVFFLLFRFIDILNNNNFDNIDNFDNH